MSKSKLPPPIVYRPKYTTIDPNYSRQIRRTGEDVEIVSFYKVDDHMVTHSPDYTKLIDEILKMLRGTGISKITITMLDKNL